VIFGAEPNPAKFSCFIPATDLGVYASQWPTPTYAAADTVSATLMHDSVMNEYILDAATKSGTDWVVTFPTKRFYSLVGTGAAIKLFQRNFNGGTACDDVTLNIYDREEKTTSAPVTFSPPTPGQTTSLCFEANVITFNNSNVLASKNSKSVSDQGFVHGWLRLGFKTTTSTTYHTLGNTGLTSHAKGVSTFSTGLTKTYLGLPVVGFAVQSFTNGTLVVSGANILANYGGNFVHKTTTTLIN